MTTMTTLRLASIAVLLGFVMVPAGSAVVTKDAMAFTSGATQPSPTVKKPKKTKKPKKSKTPKKCKKYTKNSKKWKKCVKCAKYKKGSKKWKKCVKKYASLETDDDIYAAGYWLAAACSEVVIDKTAMLGSVGVVIGIQDKDGGRTIEFVSDVSPKKRLDPKTEAGR